MKRILFLISFIILIMNALAFAFNINDLRIELARRDFWEFCKINSPEFYREDRVFLREYCQTLQALYEGRIVKFSPEDPWQLVDQKPLQDHLRCTRLMINVPPRHGKSRTLVLFTAWVFGHDNESRVITCSYNDEEAKDFSKYTRDTIMEEKSDVDANDIVYTDIFPGTKVKHGDASFGKWALDGQFFNYKGAGIGGAVTGKGGKILIVDDPVKGDEIAYSETALNKIWKWYTGTFLSRREEGAIEIMNHTRWSDLDPCGRILAGPDGHSWYVFKREAYDSASDMMLCPDLLSQESYEYLKRNADRAIFMANYHQVTIDDKDRLYRELKTYTSIPMENGHPIFERIINYTDTADEGDDYLCSIIAGEYRKELWVLDVLYTKAGMEITEPQTAEFFVQNDVRHSKIESNNGGRGFARAVERILWDDYGTRRVHVSWFHQTKNKLARIITESNYIMQHVYFPHNWHERWPEFFKDIMRFKKESKNVYYDAPDALTGLAEMVNQGVSELQAHRAI